jgi:REP element-mobilizing transposase RayT
VHAGIREWSLHAISARSNHVHLVVTARAAPEKVRDQFKANATRVLRQMPDPVVQTNIWTQGGDIEFVDSDCDLEQVMLYVSEAQDRMDRE